MSLFLGDAGSRRFLDDFLVPSLHRAVAFAKMYGVALTVRKYLEFDVTWLLEKLLHVHHVVVERGARLCLGDRNGGNQRCFRMHHTHAAAAAATGCLDDDRITDVPRESQIFVGVLAQRAIRARYAWHTGGFHGADCRHLIAHQANGIGGWPDKHETRTFAALCEIGVLRQEAVTRVNAGRVGNLSRADDRGHVEVTVYRGRRADANGFVGE